MSSSVEAAAGVPLKLSAPDWCFFRPGMDPSAYYARLREMGACAVEMVSEPRFAAARAEGLEILNLAGPGMMEGLNREANHAALIPEICAVVEQAAAHEIGAVIVFSGNRDGQPADEGLEQVAAGLSLVLPPAERLGVELWFEMLCQRDHPDYQADHAAYGFELARRLASKHFRILYDVYHMAQMGEHVAEDVLGHLGEIAHLHLADLPARGGPESDERIPFRDLTARVQRAGYEGHWGLEFLPRGDTLDALQRAIGHVGSSV
jgi:hydroxypyruvate isomerase